MTHAAWLSHCLRARHQLRGECVSLRTTTIASSGALTATFLAWYRSERAEHPYAVESGGVVDQDALALGQDRIVRGVPRDAEPFGDPGHGQVLAQDGFQRPPQPTHDWQSRWSHEAGRKPLRTVPCSWQATEVKRLRKTLRRWRDEILAYFTTGGVSNGGTEAINGVVEKTRRLAHGFRNFTNYRIRILLAADGSRPYRRRPPNRPEPR